ncbi:hypothetical protein BJ508DRAFT_411051 [Ascobolus immersus RN42]|uniref:Restriction of telomere capping protein 4 n=1 Tax=Ascobolus immersus RN42 TaxID=1160509 RepID=A0A3N4IL77_ASCIM|nr:hypothetical protein BJ508DRAFT_411051 [Ascobolus immersus RN42]
MANTAAGTPKRKRTTSRTDDIENANESSSSLSDCPSDLSVDSRPSKQLKKAPKKAPKKEEKPKCPICEKELSLSFYKSWGSKAVHKLQKQSEMHAAHEKSDFEKEAVANKYPAVDVNWDKLQKRAAKHMAYLKELTNGKHESPFRKAMKSRKKKDIQYTPGYYGPRGARVLMEQILRVLQDDILAAGQTDRAIAAGGITAFAQCVLVPELGIRLIMEDMKVDSEEAAKIMKATIKMGERLNEDEDDLLEDEEEGEGWLAV